MSLEFLTWWGLGAALGLGVWLLIRVDERKRAEQATRWAIHDAELDRKFKEQMLVIAGWQKMLRGEKT